MSEKKHAQSQAVRRFLRIMCPGRKSLFIAKLTKNRAKLILLHQNVKSPIVTLYQILMCPGKNAAFIAKHTQKRA